MIYFLILICSFSAEAKIQTPSCDSAIVTALVRANTQEQLVSVKNFADSIVKFDLGTTDIDNVRLYSKDLKFVESSEFDKIIKNCSLTKNQ